jgi:putative FmdB family regulatory protein
MPIYEYKCKKCKETFEVFRTVRESDEKVACPKCGAKDPERQISVYIPKNSSDCSTVRYG